MVAEALVERGVEAEVGPAAEVDEVEGYDGIIVGGALYNGRWHQDATAFVGRHLDVLRATRVWFFSSGPLDDSARSGALAAVPQVRDLARETDVCGHVTFGGYLEPRSPGWLSGLLSYGRPGDYRDPAQVAEWVDRIVLRLGEPKISLRLPDVRPPTRGVAGRMFRRLRDAGDDNSDDDLGLDVLT